MIVLVTLWLFSKVVVYADSYVNRRLETKENKGEGCFPLVLGFLILPSHALNMGKGCVDVCSVSQLKVRCILSRNQRRAENNIHQAKNSQILFTKRLNH